MNAEELALREALGIPSNYTSVLIFEQSAHCDWDWVSTFEQYYYPGGGQDPVHQAVRSTLEQAVTYIGDGITNSLPYTYVYCEVAYLQKFLGDPNVAPSVKDNLAQYAKSGAFLFSSGGITSAENLTLHTESFIRNYLMGRQWLKETFGATASNQMWIPDDFGHDAQLPVLLQAMGFTGAGFWRIPAQAGAPNNSCSNGNPTSIAPSNYLQNDVGYDFLWQARDGSRIQAHWLANGYCEGNAFGSPPTASMSAISGLIAQNTTPVMPTNYMFVPIDCDFTAPFNNGPSVAQQWNQQTPQPTTFAIQASFDVFMKLVAAASTNPDGSSSLQTVYTDGSGTSLPPFVPHPYYSGCYASRPFIKTTHYQVVRTLLFTESMQLILQSLAPYGPLWSLAATTALANLNLGWNYIAPSTHHDYIPGTATDGTCGMGADVYFTEQVPLLNIALQQAQMTQATVLAPIAGAISTNLANPVAIFNGLGFERTAVADLAAPPAGGPFVSSTVDNRNFTPVQIDGNGGLLVQADVNALGYTTVSLSTKAATVPNVLTASIASSVVTMTNGSISATITAAGITSLSAPGGTNILGGTGNELRFYHDNGSIYRFGNELPCYPPNWPNAQFSWDQSLTLANASITLPENGPLRATAIVTGTVNNAPVTITYQLYATDTALRISVTSGTPTNHALMARFPFASAAASLTYGTTAHWDIQAPRQYFSGLPAGVEAITFEPTHEYVGAVGANGGALGAVYHYATPAWGIDSGGALLGCLMRNTPGQQNAACANDNGVYTMSYAVALPAPPSLRAAALDINNPLVAVAIPPSGTVLPASMSIASTNNPGALITAAKAGTVDPSQIILRFYQSTDQPLTGVTVTLDPTIAGAALTASAVTALEQPSPQNLNITVNENAVTLDLPYAITTIALGSST